MGIKISIDRAAVEKLERAALKAANQSIDALQGDVESKQVMPFDNGDMQNNQTFTEIEQQGRTIKARLVTGAPQARRLYYHPEYNFQTVNNHNAGGEWLEPWSVGEQKSFLEDTYAKIFKREAGV